MGKGIFLNLKSNLKYAVILISVSNQLISLKKLISFFWKNYDVNMAHFNDNPINLQTFRSFCKINNFLDYSEGVVKIEPLQETWY